MRGDIFHQHFLFAAEAAADARLDDADALDGQSQHGGEHTSHVEGYLRGGADHQPVILVPIRDRDVRLDVCLLHFRHAVFGFKDLIGFGESFFHVADVDADFRGEIFLGMRIRKVDIFRLIVNPDRFEFHGFARVQNGGQDFVFDFDQRQGFLRDFGRLRRDERDAVTHEADFVVERERVQRPGDRVGLARGGVDDARDVLPCQNCRDTLESARPAGINPLDAGVRVRRVEHLGVEQSALFDIRREGRFALHQFDRVQFDLGFADGIPCGGLWRQYNFWQHLCIGISCADIR
jgi:hypothetical protein